VAYLAHDGWAPEYRRSVRSTFATFYRWLNAEGAIDQNPGERLPRVRVPMGQARPASDDDVRTTLTRADERQRRMLLLGVIGALRRHEIAKVHTDDVDGWGDLRVVGKGGKVRTVHITQALAREIKRQPRGWLFPNGHGGHLTSAHVGVLLRRILPTGVTPHMLRHNAASAWHDAGLSILDLMEALGHASAATTQRYVFEPSGIASDGREPAGREVSGALEWPPPIG
jgi:integrase/recombinase XerC